MTLANNSYAPLASLCDSAGQLNLAWSLDEQAFFAPPLAQLIASALADGASQVAHYPVQDPWGEQMLGPTVYRHLDIDPAHAALTCGAGVGTLLHGLAGLAQGAAACICGDVYPDFPHWVTRMDGRCIAGAAGADHAAVVLVERPAMRGAECDHPRLRALCAALAGTGALVVVDESNANYCAPGYSAACLLATCRQLVVLRGLSKAFHMGGLRLGYALCHPTLAARVRARLPPMQVASLSLVLGRAILDHGDRCDALRKRIATTRIESAALLATSTCPHRFRSNQHAPYLFCADPDGAAAAWLAARGIVSKRQPFWTGSGLVHELRLSVPLTSDRMRQFAGKLQA